MIHPNMATMLAVVTTDAAVEPGLWRSMLRAGADASFNQISVDGDTSTNSIHDDSVEGVEDEPIGGKGAADVRVVAAGEALRGR